MAATPTAPVRARVLGVPVDVCDVFATALDLHRRGGGQIVTLNAEMTMAAKADPALGAGDRSGRVGHSRWGRCGLGPRQAGPPGAPHPWHRDRPEIT